MRNLSISTKIYAATILSTVLAFLGAFIVQVRANSITTKYEQQLDAYTRKDFAARVLELDFKKQVQEWKDILLRGRDSEDLRKYRTQFFQMEDQVQSDIAVLENKLTDAQSMETLNQFKHANEALDREYRGALEVFTRDGAADFNAADTLVRGKDRQPTDLLEQISQHAQDGFLKYIAAQKTVRAGDSGWALTILCIAVLAGIIFSLLLSSGIINSIHALTAAVQEIAAKRDFSIRVPKQNHDELGMLADSFNDMLVELESRNLNLNMAKDEAEIANRSKSEFLANMSHELRTPLNGVIGMAELLINSKLTGRQHDYALTVRRSSESLLTILNDILDLAKIEAGKMTIESIPMDLQNVVEEVGVLMSARASEKKLELIMRYSPEAPRMLMGDPVRIRQVLSNIVGNAVKFTSKGHVLIEAACASRGNGQAAICLRIEDTGIGIPEHQISKLFQKFTQADASTTRRFGGTGLGLAICKNIVEMMNGEVEVSSTPGKGSVFTITLPLVQAPYSEQPAKATAEDLHGLRFLIVDDNPVNRMVLCEQLTSWRIRHTAMDSAESALKALADAAKLKDPYDVALLDFQMPAMDGETLAKAIKGNPVTNGVMLMMLTSMGHDLSGKRMKEAGLSGLLHKPVRQSILLETLNRAWNVYTGKTPSSAFGSGELPPVMPSRMLPAVTEKNVNAPRKILLVEDNEVNREVALGMLERLECTAAVAVDGREAVDMILRDEFDLVLMDCHMPVMDGFEATAEIRKLEQLAGNGKHIPIVAMTANAMKGDRELCLNSGMDEYVSKPVRLQTLAEVMQKFSRQTTEFEKTSSAETANAGTPDVEIFNYDAALETASGKVPRLQRIINAFLNDAPKRLNAFKNALDSGERLAAEREAHSLKGAAANIAAQVLRDRAFKAERACKSGELKEAAQFIPMLEKDVDEVAAVLTAKFAVEAAIPV